MAMTLPAWFVAVCVGGTIIGACSRASAEIVAQESFEYPRGELSKADRGAGWEADQSWKSPPGKSQYVCDDKLTYPLPDGESLGRGRAIAIHGTGDRSNPLRRQLKAPFTGDSLFVRFLLRYNAESIDDLGSMGDGEFFVLWLDDIDGGDGANHNPNVPNIGVTLRNGKEKAADGKNYFMARIGAENTTFSGVELAGDRTYLIVARLTKTKPGALSPYDRLELWVDPDPKVAAAQPAAVVHARGFNSIRWVGFSTGKKTETSDFILIDELALGERWDDVIPGGIAKPLETPAAESVAKAGGHVDFGRDVFPILREHCFDCHQGRDAESGHRLDVREEILGHYQGHPLAIPKDSQNSPLIQRLTTSDKEKLMPQGGDPLPDEQVAVLRAWIDQGLDWDEQLLPSTPPESEHWSFRTVKRPPVPSLAPVSRPGESKLINPHPIDAFIAAKHTELGLAFAPEADRRTLLRRVTLDLTGLPPTREEIKAFLADDSPDAFEKVVDRLLSSPQYGEHWGRHWLDLARWAESDGHQHNYKRAHAWRYRDYVVQSFTNNKRYDQFIREQVAGDELQPYSDDNLIATGFLAAARYSDNEMDKQVQRADILVDITNTTATALLGLTMQCAQCHSHKFDPISQRDYYRFMGFFVRGQPLDVLLRGDESSPNMADEQAVLDAIDEQYEILSASRSQLEAEQRMKGLPNIVTTNDVVSRIPPEQKKRFQELEKLIAGCERTWAYYSPATSPNKLGAPYLKTTSPLQYSLHMLQRAKPVLYVRGDVDSPGPEVDVGWPAVFGQATAGDKTQSRPRTALADWLTDRNNPLTARVWVNRVWLYHFGRGLAPTPDDFGLQGEPPTHPELLDWLAAELLESGWNTGHIHRLIMNSRTYQQSSQYNEKFAQLDPENQFYWRWQRRRLEAESIRDSMLAVAGLLDAKVGGESVPVKERDDSTRRTIYLEQKRSDLPFVQQLFDAPSTLNCCGRRRNSTVALQPLFLLNDSRIYEYAKAFAQRVTDEVGDDLHKQMERAFEIVVGRLPRAGEQVILAGFFDRNADRKSSSADHRLVHFCHSLLNLNEFVYIP
jgi:hypothetical protein